MVLLLSSGAPPAAKLRSRRRGTASGTDGGQCGPPVADGRCRDTSIGAPAGMQRSARNTQEPPYTASARRSRNTGKTAVRTAGHAHTTVVARCKLLNTRCTLFITHEARHSKKPISRRRGPKGSLEGSRHGMFVDTFGIGINK